MYKKSPVSWSKHLDFMILDTIFLQFAYILSYFFRNDSFGVYTHPVYREMAIVVLLLDICVAVFLESYNDILRRGWMVELFATARHVLYILAGELFFLFFAKISEEFSRLALGYFGMISVLLLYIERCVWKQILLHNLLKIKNKRILLLVAEKERAVSVLEKMKSQPFLDFSVGGVILAEPFFGEKQILGVPVVADLSGAEAYLEKNVVDEVLFVRSPKGELPQELIRKCELMGLTIHIEISEGENLPSASTIENISGIAVLSSCVKLVTTKQIFIKRIMDILGSLVGLFFTFLISLFLFPAIYIADPGPVIFSQKRIGKNGRPFMVYKFRSMYRDAEARKKEFEAKNQISGPMFKLEADPRIIGSGPDGRRHGLGWFIRTTSLDEFPQFWNVLKGDMSLVGTRPPTLDEWEQYELQHRARMAIKPGITGMWQVSGRSDILDFEEVVRLDTDYIRNWSPALDMKILIKTIGVVLMKRGSR